MGNRKEGMIIGGIKIIGVENLQQFIDLCLYGKEPEEEGRGKEVRESEHVEKADFADMLGQEEVKRAALIAAAGFHNLLMTGRPGGGKTMTAKRIPGILPPLTDEESLEVMQIHSIGGILDAEAGLVRQRPFRASYYRLSAAALIGGGRIPQPGEVSLAHRGVLFLDELAEMGPGILENLRQPLEEKYVNISRLSGDYCFPADFLLVAAMNNCPCGNYPDMNRCTCSRGEIHHYQTRVSQPILDRIELSVDVEPVPFTALMAKENSPMSSKVMRECVMLAREMQQRRYKEEGVCFNSQLRGSQVKKFCSLGIDEEKRLEMVFRTFSLSARATTNLLKTARTIADLEACDKIEIRHINEAVSFRGLDRTAWKA